MPELDALKKPKRVSIDLDGEILNVTYNAKFSTEMYLTLRQLTEAQRNRPENEEPPIEEIERTTHLLAEILMGWDITDKKKPVPCTEQEVRRLDMGDQGKILGAVFEDLFPNAATSAPS